MVSDDRMCSSDQNRPAALSLWEQARTGLLASIVAREGFDKSSQAAVFVHRQFRPLDGRASGLSPDG